MSLLTHAGFRYLRRHRGQCALAIIGVALGVSMIIGIQITQKAARDSFVQSIDTVFGRATHQISMPNGLLPVSTLATVRRLLPDALPSPVLRGQLQVEVDGQPHYVQLIGIDPIAGYARNQSSEIDMRRFVRQPGTVIVNARTASRLKLRVGQAFDVISVRGKTTLVPIAISVDDRSAMRLIDGALLADIATVDEILGAGGRLSAIELTVAGANDARIDQLGNTLPPTSEIIPRGRAERTARQLTQAFYTNLDALSLLAIMVGAFMIFNTMRFLSLQRTATFSRLRAIGVLPDEIYRQVLLEAAVLGGIGAALGIILGILLAGVLVSPMTTTLSDLYFRASPAVPIPEPGLLLIVWTGVVALALTSAWLPARAASRTAPARTSHIVTEKQQRKTALHALPLAMALAAIASGLLLFTSTSLLAGFAALGAIVLAGTLLTPLLVASLFRIGEPALCISNNVTARIILRGVRGSLGRTGVAIAALMAATATSIGVALMVASFRVSVDDWLNSLMRADFYVSEDMSLRTDPTLSARDARSILANPSVAAVSKVRRSMAQTNYGKVRLTAFDLPETARSGFRILDGDKTALWSRWETERVVMVSEPLAFRLELRPGQRIAIRTPRGEADFEVAAVYQDYANQHGTVAMNWDTHGSLWDETLAHSFGIYLVNQADSEAAEEALATFAGSSGRTLWSNLDLRKHSMAIFDRTFLITDSMTLLAAMIASLGMMNALLALNLEKAREFATLRALGCSGLRLAGSIVGQSLIMAIAAVLIAIPLGTVIAGFLIAVINVRSFGWTMPMLWQADALILPCTLALLGAIAAAMIPAFKGGWATPAAVLRND